ncbi:hypothetical protein [Streptomyces sp. DSM 15324]|uniref:hypothetical protein n=1 Tax=Streptomyces sp. DSM 15324 TaxID=1739111 RepID=UPI00074880C1|nr:hypothetical protein [Streptomyces sp. DSM 15324]KUO08711.1 hypothetical protein AQJ58_29045 [Streptomyces sp. DSM 15324]
MTAPHEVRLLRAAVFTAVCVVLAAAGHTMASCATVPPWTLGVGFLGALAVVVPLAGRERSLPGMVGLLAVGQTVLHTLFGLGQHTAATTTGAMPTSDAALVARAARLVCGATAAAISPAQARKILVDARLYSPTDGTGMTGMSGMSGMGSMTHSADALSAAGPGMSLLPSLPMALGHLLAALATGWLLRRGDSALRRLIELSAHGVAEGALVRSLRGALALVRALLAGLPTAPGTGPCLTRTALLTPPRPRTTALQHTVIRRGPPTGSVLVLAA